MTPDPITGQKNNLITGQPNEIPPAATVAGIYAATDVARGVWKAPAGFQAITNNVTGVPDRGAMTDNRQGITEKVILNGTELTGWKMYKFPFKTVTGLKYIGINNTISAGWHTNVHPLNGPTIYKGIFNLTKVTKLSKIKIRKYINYLKV